MKIKNFIFKILMFFSVAFLLTSCVESKKISLSNDKEILENGSYYDKDDVVSYLKEYKKLPNNFITKKQAKKLGWIPKKGNLWVVTDKKVIGGDYFGNFEKNLPDGDYRECDVNYYGGKRGDERLVFDKDINIYYTNDHYNSFTKEN